MKFAVIGASAGVGLELVKQLLDHGHTVNTLSRSIGTIPEHERVHKIVGSALNEADIAQAIDASLARLGTDYVDVYFSHAFDPAVPQADTLGAYQRLIDAGKVRAIGASNFSVF